MYVAYNVTQSSNSSGYEKVCQYSYTDFSTAVERSLELHSNATVDHFDFLICLRVDSHSFITFTIPVINGETIRANRREIRPVCEMHSIRIDCNHSTSYRAPIKILYTCVYKYAPNV